jgi:hypothetical protein
MSAIRLYPIFMAFGVAFLLQAASSSAYGQQTITANTPQVQQISMPPTSNWQIKSDGNITGIPGGRPYNISVKFEKKLSGQPAWTNLPLARSTATLPKAEDK